MESTNNECHQQGNEIQKDILDGQEIYIKCAGGCLNITKVVKSLKFTEKTQVLVFNRLCTPVLETWTQQWNYMVLSSLILSEACVKENKNVLFKHAMNSSRQKHYHAPNLTKDISGYIGSVMEGMQSGLKR